MQAERLIQGAQLLADADFPTALADLRNVAKEDALAMARTLLARLARLQPPESRCKRSRLSATHKGVFLHCVRYPHQH